MRKLLLLLAAAAACTGRPEPLPPLVLDTVLGPGEVRCGPVTKESELIGGPQAFAQVGRSWRCHNAKIRFIVQDTSRPVGNSSVGGNLIDIDLVRPDELADGEDTFREHVSAVGANEVRVESIEVVNDGRAGGDGILRVTGTPGVITIIPQAAHLAQDISSTTIVTDYVLRPDVDYLEIVTTVKNAGPPLPSVQPADFIAFGGATTPHTPETGYGSIEMFEHVSLLSAARGDKVSYAVASDEGDVIVPLMEHGITAPFYGTGAPVGSERSFVRWLIVGDGSLESTTRRALSLKGVTTGTITGTVRIDGQPPGRRIVVSALSAPLGEPDAHVVSEAYTSDTGGYTLTLPGGDYLLVAHAPGLARSPEVPAHVHPGAETNAAELAPGGAGHLDVTTSFVDRAGAPLAARPAKLTLVAQAGTQQPSDVLGDFDEGGATFYFLSTDGRFTVDVPPGNYTAYVTRGFEFSRSQTDVAVNAGETVTLAATLEHALDTTGLVGTELHQHCIGSIDAQVPYPVKVLENAAEGVELAASTDHDTVTDFQPYVDSLGLKPWLSVVAGSEVTYTGIGHFNAFPWNIDHADPHKDTGSRLWWLKNIRQTFADIRAAAGDPVIQINHPRSQMAGYFGSLPIDPTTAARIARDAPGLETLPADVYSAWSGDFEAIEVNGSLGDVTLYTAERRAELSQLANESAFDVPVLADWFAMLGAGKKVSATGSSDSHRQDNGVGYPRSFLTVDQDDPSALTGDDLRAALRAQRTAIGEGCLLELFADGARRQGLDQLTAATAQVTAKLQAPPHVTPGRFEVYVNGLARPLVLDADGAHLDPAGTLSPVVTDAGATDAVVRLDHVLEGLPTDEGDLAVVVVSNGGSGLAPTGGGSVFCFSGALYLDVDGDGAWTPWLAATQQVVE
ncbi:MAG: hypothetical protein A2138_14720 [Deltaproteobacteria bacterium RBG_16_71_12]|nr:MAG: hypothetical protein A2138_14720 [Deltaproteobacteria bacterium RBG_16_71_12]